MIVGIMQPYFFPYIGYFQLMAACDVFLLHDNVQYIYQGWVNRNRMLVNGAAEWMTIPVAASSHKLAIMQREYLLADRAAVRLPMRIAGAYRTAPFFARTMALLEQIFSFSQSNVADFNANLLRKTAAHIGIDTPLLRTSELDGVAFSAYGERRVIEICSRMRATRYINPIGGRDLYSGRTFAEAGIELCFQKCEVLPYGQFGAPHVPFLSIIDVLMFNDLSEVSRMLGQHTIEPSIAH
jgi:hypothetical protein